MEVVAEIGWCSVCSIKLMVPFVVVDWFIVPYKGCHKGSLEKYWEIGVQMLHDDLWGTCEHILLKKCQKVL